jgi:hypothetical protein
MCRKVLDFFICIFLSNVEMSEMLRRLSFVPREYTAQSFFAHDLTFTGRRKVGAQDLVPDVYALIRWLVVIVRQPFTVDVVELTKVQAKDNGLR